MPRWTFWTSPAKVYRVMVGSGGRRPKKMDIPPSSGSARLRSASAHHSSLLGELVRVLRSQVVGLGEVIGQVVQLPDVLFRVIDAGGESLDRLRGEVPGRLV